VSRTQGTSARDFEERSGTGILLTPERPITRNGGIAETVTDVPRGDAHPALGGRSVDERCRADRGQGYIGER
jgi:hypothetical protein